MKQIALLNYSFMFDPTETWQHASQFESMLSKYLEEYGVKAEIIKPLGMTGGNKIIYCSKIEMPPLPKVKQSTGPAGEQIRKLGKIGK